MAKGRFITIEGADGVGKSTQARRLCIALREHGEVVLCTREPGGSPGAEAIRGLLVQGEPARWDAMTEALLHFAARRDHLTNTVRPALARGDWVVSDRFADSTVAYQGYAQGLGREAVAKLYDMVVGDLMPDLTLILDLPVDAGLARADRRGGDDDRYERMDPGFHEKLRNGFLEIARAEPGRCVMIDASADADTVHAAILAVVRERFGLAADD
ncbi:MAG: dTMP kinase [Alphaproteobacteria bacterium]